MPQNRRKTFLLVLCLISIPATLCVLFSRHSASGDSAPKFPGRNDNKFESVGSLTGTPKPETSPLVSQSSFVTAPEIPKPPKDAEEILPTHSKTGTPAPPRPPALPTSGSPAMAVVDVERLLAELLPAGASTETRAETLRKIQQAASQRAAAHNFDLILNRSSKGLSHVPFVLTAAGVWDLTEDVRRELTK